MRWLRLGESIFAIMQHLVANGSVTSASCCLINLLTIDLLDNVTLLFQLCKHQFNLSVLYVCLEVFNLDFWKEDFFIQPFLNICRCKLRENIKLTSSRLSCRYSKILKGFLRHTKFAFLINYKKVMKVIKKESKHLYNLHKIS